MTLVLTELALGLGFGFGLAPLWSSCLGL